MKIDAKAKANWDSFIARIVRHLSIVGSERQQVSELAKYLGKTQTQAVEWIFKNKQPNGATALMMQEWLFLKMAESDTRSRRKDWKK